MSNEIKKNLSWWEFLMWASWSFITVFAVFTISISFKDNVRQLIHPRPKVASIQIRGLLTDSREIVKQIRKFAAQEKIKAILLHIDSPGGSVASAQLIFSELMRAKEKKPVVALLENLCASAAYCVAASADYIVAPASSIVGNIGVTSFIPNVKEFADDWKVSVDLAESEKFKTVRTPLCDLMKAQERAYDTFVGDVARARPLSGEQKTVWADGKLFTGEQALKLGLVDRIGDLTDLESELKKRGKFEGEIEYIEEPRLFRRDSDD